MIRREFMLLVFLPIMLVMNSGCQSKQEMGIDSGYANSNSDGNSKVIRLANGNWPPYNGEFLPEGGCDSQIVKETFLLAGYEVEYEYFPWARSYSLSATGAWDGTLAWDDTPAHREDHWISAKPTTVQEWVFFFSGS